MNIKNFNKDLFQIGKSMGFAELEIYFQCNQKYRIRVFGGDIDNYDISVESGLSIRAIYNGKMGYAYTEKIDKDSILFLLNEAKENSLITENSDIETIYKDSGTYEEAGFYSEELARVSTEEKVSLLQKIEKECFAQSEKVTNVKQCVLEYYELETMIANTKGLYKSEKNNFLSILVSVVVKKEKELKNAYKFYVTKKFYDLDSKKIAIASVNEALSLLGGEMVESDYYPIILKNTAAASLIQAFSGVLNAENILKHKLKLQNMIGKQVANPCVNIVDNPFLQNGYNNRSFDNEGVPTIENRIIEYGLLKTYFHNLNTSKKLNVKSTGSAHKKSYKEATGISPSNMYIAPGKLNLADLIKLEERCILVTDLQGLHSGTNPISGDFSLAAQGFLVDKGVIKHSINHFTIAGNFYTFLNEIENIADDLDFCLPTSVGFFGSPSLKISSLSVGSK